MADDPTYTVYTEDDAPQAGDTVPEGVREVPAGVFSLRTPPRPNPIAVQEVEILAVRDGEMDVVGLDCLDGTPLLDIKRTKK